MSHGGYPSCSRYDSGHETCCPPRPLSNVDTSEEGIEVQRTVYRKPGPSSGRYVCNMPGKRRLGSSTGSGSEYRKSTNSRSNSRSVYRKSTNSRSSSGSGYRKGTSSTSRSGCRKSANSRRSGSGSRKNTDNMHNLDSGSFEDNSNELNYSSSDESNKGYEGPNNLEIDDDVFKGDYECKGHKGQ